MRRNTREAPTNYLGKMEMHCPACHRDTVARRPSSLTRGVICWECGTLLPAINQCWFHDPRFDANGETAEARHAIYIDGPACAYQDDETGQWCPGYWTIDDIEDLPGAHIDLDENPGGCSECPDEYAIVDGTGPVVAYWSHGDVWRIDRTLAYRYFLPEKAWQAAGDHGGRVVKLERGQ